MGAQPYFLPSIAHSPIPVWSPKAQLVQSIALNTWASKHLPKGMFLGQWVAHMLSCLV